jgi:hypothetical protein
MDMHKMVVEAIAVIRQYDYEKWPSSIWSLLEEFDLIVWAYFSLLEIIVLCIYYIISGGYLINLHSFAQMNTKKWLWSS